MWKYIINQGMSLNIAPVGKNTLQIITLMSHQI